MHFGLDFISRQPVLACIRDHWDLGTTAFDVQVCLPTDGVYHVLLDSLVTRRSQPFWHSFWQTALSGNADVPRMAISTSFCVISPTLIGEFDIENNIGVLLLKLFTTGYKHILPYPGMTDFSGDHLGSWIADSLDHQHFQ